MKRGKHRARRVVPLTAKQIRVGLRVQRGCKSRGQEMIDETDAAIAALLRAFQKAAGSQWRKAATEGRDLAEHSYLSAGLYLRDGSLEVSDPVVDERVNHRPGSGCEEPFPRAREQPTDARGPVIRGLGSVASNCGQTNGERDPEGDSYQHARRPGVRHRSGGRAGHRNRSELQEQPNVPPPR